MASKFYYSYKYLPFSEGSIRTITDGTIKFTCPLEFNDPFDCSPYYDPAALDDLGKTRPDLIRKTAQMAGLKLSERFRRKPMMIKSIKDRVLDDTHRKSVLAKVGLVSLSRDPLNLLMWAHYADCHRGFVLEFEIPATGTKEDVSRGNELLVGVPVTYSKHRPVLMLGQDREEELLFKLLLTKSEDWQYEEELRVIDHKRGPGIFAYQRDRILSSVICGIRMEKDNKAVLADALSELEGKVGRKFDLYEAKQSVKDYKLTVPAHPRLAD